MITGNLEDSDESKSKQKVSALRRSVKSVRGFLKDITKNHEGERKKQEIKSDQLIEDKHNLIVRKFEKKTRKCVIKENNKIKVTWDFWCIICVLVVAFCVPYRLAFGLKDSNPYNIIEWITTMSFVADIFLCFLTETFDEEKYTTVSEYRQIAILYLRGWFLFDVFSIIPFDLILSKKGPINSNVN